MPTKAELERRVAQLEAYTRSYDSFMSQVREVAIRVSNEQDWCRSGLNEVLRELELEEVPDRWLKEITIKVKYSWDGDEEEPPIGGVRLDVGYYNELTIEGWEFVEEGDPVGVSN